ncbi:hypothetical protein, partial [Mycoplasmopsis bovis]|uniref:hypothetical protein n=1 Tax=Mycoplasmopsis bovis TaxID=28903 RepID=UPI003D265C10
IKSKFKSLLSGYKEAIKRHAYKVGANNKVFQTINFGNKGENLLFMSWSWTMLYLTLTGFSGLPVSSKSYKACLYQFASEVL